MFSITYHQGSETSAYLRKDSCFLPESNQHWDQCRPVRKVGTTPRLGPCHSGHFNGPKKEEDLVRTQVVHASCIICFFLGTAGQSKTAFLLSHCSRSLALAISPFRPQAYPLPIKQVARKRNRPSLTLPYKLFSRDMQNAKGCLEESIEL